MVSDGKSSKEAGPNLQRLDELRDRAVNLWLENEEGSYRYWRGRAKDAKREAKDDRYADARGLLAAWLKAELEESAPELGATLWSDLLSAALSEVNWYEIAQHLLEE